MENIRQRAVFFTLFTLMVDSLVLLGAVAFAFWLSFRSFLTDLFPITKGVPPLTEYFKAFPVILIVFWIVFKGFNLYRRRMTFSPSWNFFTIAQAVTVAIFSLMAATFLYRQDFTYSRRLVGWFWVFSIVGLTASRRLIGKIEIWWWEKYLRPRQILLIGEGPVARRLRANLEANPRWAGEAAGLLWIDRKPRAEDFPGLPLLGHVDDFERVVASHPVSEVILTSLSLPHPRIISLIAECEKSLIDFKLVPDVFSLMSSRVWVTNLDGIPLLGFKMLPLHSAWNRFVKRSFDLAGAALGLVLSAPVLLFCALLSKLTSRGSVFYRQERMGENGKLFPLYKLRTMPMDAEKATGPVWSSADDPRATQVGRALRLLGLDELPQFWNVLKGDMSLVGPRPERQVFVEQFKEDIPRYMSRHLVKSGVTGWAQVNGLRGDTSVKARLEYDMYYLENWSIFFDIKILLLTIFSRRSRVSKHRA
jgi:exopolysaccharide biosynthesis polyprenyl glycosylphosphotransferase